MSDLIFNFHNLSIRIYKRIYLYFCRKVTEYLFFVNRVSYKSFNTCGIPLLEINQNGKIELGENVIFINNALFSTLGRPNKCKISVYENAKLCIGSNVGISNATLVATQLITIGNNVMIGGGVTIVDSDFHSIDFHHWFTDNDLLYMARKPVIIGDNVFIGMNTLILKGVTIGSNSIIAAGSVVNSNVPDYQIWGGNPAKFIRNNCQ